MATDIVEPITGVFVAFVSVPADSKAEIRGTGDLPAKIRCLGQVNNVIGIFFVGIVGPHHQTASAAGGSIVNGQSDGTVLGKGLRNPCVGRKEFRLYVDVDVGGFGGGPWERRQRPIQQRRAAMR